MSSMDLFRKANDLDDNFILEGSTSTELDENMAFLWGKMTAEERRECSSQIESYRKCGRV